MQNTKWSSSLPPQVLMARLKLAEAGHEKKLQLWEDLMDKGIQDTVFQGCDQSEREQATLLVAKSLIERGPAFDKLAASVLLSKLTEEALGKDAVDLGRFGGSLTLFTVGMRKHFREYLNKAVSLGLLDKRLLEFNIDALAEKLDFMRDFNFGYIGLQTLYDRYFLVDKTDSVAHRRIETPQFFFMRVAMGVTLNRANLRDIETTELVIRRYRLLSSFDFMCSTPTLFNAGTPRPQLSSCYLSTVPDDLDGIYQSIKENALLAKYAGGLGNDWTPVRAMGAHIKGTNGESQGVVPFLKVANDTAIAVNQGGKRKGAVCAYLETWHLDIEEFLELRKNTGDDRRRTHDMNTANWVPDLFMRRVVDDLPWTLFSPSDVPDLHEKYGKEFEAAYLGYEVKAYKGELKLFKIVQARELWRKMLSMLFETGHPWITFKDPCNIRSPQKHVGVVHSSNLCTEITLNTNQDEIAVCNLGSINLANHVDSDGLDLEHLKETVYMAVSILDSIIDINYYAVDKARNSNLKHRPIGLGIMGFQDCLHKMRRPYASEGAVHFADRSMEAVCYFAYCASALSARWQGTYETFKGSLWDKGILPHDTLEILRAERGGNVEVNMSSSMPWDSLRKQIDKYGMRNSNCVAIAPTATISNIVGVSASIEPSFQNIFAKSNLSGEFVVVNQYLVAELEKLGLWDDAMIAELKANDGSVANIDRVPRHIKNLYATAFEIDPKWLVEAAARRQKWIDQAQSLNIYMAGVSGKKLDEIYTLAWRRGLKTTYYLRTISASHVEKSTGVGGELNAVKPNVCALRKPGEPVEECEACQ